ncbi:MAG: Hint domain-containing protein [Mangrovicoccus sp.]
MAQSFATNDTEFAIASGSNVYVNASESRFDAEPGQWTGLTVTPKPGDPNPYTVEVGDIYDITWSGLSTGELLNAQVVRSDIAGSGGLIVFEGTDSNDGTLKHVLWTPDYDLQGWWAANYQPPPHEMHFYVVDMAAGSYAYVCFAGQTRILTETGLCSAQDLAIGQRLWTLTGPVSPLLWKAQRRLNFTAQNAVMRPVVIPKHRFGPGQPAQDLRLSPQHRVLVQMGGQRVFVPAKALLSLPGIYQDHHMQAVTYVSLLLPKHHVIWAEGLGCESFFPGPQALDLLGNLDRLRLETAWPGITLPNSDYGGLCYPHKGAGWFRRMTKTIQPDFPPLPVTEPGLP